MFKLLKCRKKKIFTEEYLVVFTVFSCKSCVCVDACYLKHSLLLLIMYIHSRGASSRRRTCNTSVSAARARNGYTDQTWITSGTFTVQSDTRTTKTLRVNRCPSLSSHFLTLCQPEGRTWAFVFFLTAAERLTVVVKSLHTLAKNIMSWLSWVPNLKSHHIFLLSSAAALLLILTERQQWRVKDLVSIIRCLHAEWWGLYCQIKYKLRNTFSSKQYFMMWMGLAANGNV